MRKISTLVFAAVLLALAAPTHSQDPRSAQGVAAIQSAIQFSRPLPPPLVPKNHGCVERTIACGQTLTGQITNHDCTTGPPDDIFFDIFVFQGTAGQTVTATLSSNDFNPFLILFDPDVDPVAEDDDSGPGNAARIVHTLDQTSPDWTFTATPLETLVTGAYTLSLQCSGTPPPPTTCPSGFFKDPNYADFCFRVRIGDPGDTVAGNREPDCIDETVCISGRVPGRSEVFTRIIGPRPNGFLWPTIVRFTPSRVVVEIRQSSTGELNTYTLPAIPPGVDELPGLQDRTGFLP